MSEEAREVALRLLSHLERRELDDVLALCALDAEIWLPGHPTFSRQQFHDFLSVSLERLAPDTFVLKPFGTTAEGERVAVEAHSSGELKTGGRYENRYHFLFVVRGGKVQSLDVYATSGFAVTASWIGGGSPP
jgi:ketosteroid isomerase-like protein